MQRIFLIIPALYILILPASTIAAQGKFVASERTCFHTLGNKQVALKIARYGHSNDLVMVSLHNDEVTGIKAAKSVLEKTGGILLSIENNYERYITFTQKGRTYKFDPNRIFTRAGIKAALLEQNQHSPKSALRAINRFARFLLNKIPYSTFILIALHNNNNQGFSIFTYMKGGDHEKDAIAANKSSVHDPDNFFLTTDERLFQWLRSANYNAVLQRNKRARDDGSLSIYYGRKNKRYVNIEAETGSIKEQKEMIETVASFIHQR